MRSRTFSKLKPSDPALASAACALAPGTADEQVDVAAINYMTMDVAFGGITFEEASRTAALFASDVMPAFADTGSGVAS